MVTGEWTLQGLKERHEKIAQKNQAEKEENKSSVTRTQLADKSFSNQTSRLNQTAWSDRRSPKRLKVSDLLTQAALHDSKKKRAEKVPNKKLEE